MPFNGYALIIAVGDYPNLPADKKLPITSADADALYNTLTDPSKAAYPTANVVLLKDAEATKANIIAKLQWLAGAAQADSNALIFFSGHGSNRPLPDGSGRSSYLLPNDARLDDVHNTSIPSGDFQAALGKIKAGRKIVFFDACKSGGMEDAKFELQEGLTEDEYQTYATQGQIVFASSREGQLSYILSGAKNSLFTEVLLEVLGGKGLEAEAYILVSDLIAYLGTEVARRGKDSGKVQYPYYRGEGDNFPVMIANARFARRVEPGEATTERNKPIVSITGESSSKSVDGVAKELIPQQYWGITNTAGRDINQQMGDNNTQTINNSTTTTTNSGTGAGSTFGDNATIGTRTDNNFSGANINGGVNTGNGNYTDSRSTVNSGGGNVNSGTINNSGSGDVAMGDIDKSSTVNTQGGANISGGNFTSGGQQVFGGTANDNRQTNDFGGVNTGGGAFTMGQGNTVSSNVGATQPTSSQQPANTSSVALRRLMLRQIASTLR